MSDIRSRLARFNHALSWTLLEITIVMLASGYAMTFIGVDVLGFRIMHLAFDVLFTSTFLAHFIISTIVIRVNWRKVLGFLLGSLEFKNVGLWLTQRISGYAILLLGALQVVSGLDRFHLGLGSILPYTLHRVFDLYLLLSIIVHGAVAAKFALMRRSVSLNLREEERISLERRQSIRILAGSLVAIFAAFFLNNPPKVGRGQETPEGILPPGQTKVNSLRVLSVSSAPNIEAEDWRFVVDGLVDNPIDISLEEFFNLPAVTRVTDFHCVTGWTKFDNVWKGVSFETIYEMVMPKTEARFVTFEAVTGYTTSLPIIELRAPDVLFAYQLNETPLPREHGGPLRLVVPEKYGYKSAKWVTKLTFTQNQELGYWERRGYSNTANPFINDRYS